MSRSFKLVIVFLFLVSIAGKGQNCANADPFCTGIVYSFPNSVGTVSEAGPDYGCLFTQPNPNWYYLQIANSGNIIIDIVQYDNFGNGIDVDFIVWGPFNSPTAPCPNGLNSSTIVDCSYLPDPAETAIIPSAIAGQYYLFLVTNFEDELGTIEFTQTGGSGSTNCNIICGITGFTANPSTCDPATSKYALSGTLNITNPPTTGTLTISSSCGGSQSFNAPFPNTINYSLSGLNANGNNCTVISSFSSSPQCNSSVSYTAPQPCSVPACFITGINSTASACNSATGNYQITGTITYNNPPSTGQLTITACGGQQVVLNAPFGVSTNFTISNIPADGTPNCTLVASFSASPTCTITSNPFTEPVCVCNIDQLVITPGNCVPQTNTYSVSGSIQFTSPPSSGQLIVETCNGVQQVFNAPFVSPLNFNIASITPTGAACDITARFTANPACQFSVNYTSPTPCFCPAEAGTFVASITGSSQTNYVLCYGDQINITSNNDYVYPPISNNATTAYNPGVWWLVFSCPPTLFPGNINLDPCLLGVIEEGEDLSELNDLVLIDTSNGITNNTVYMVPITMYNVLASIFSVYDPLNIQYCYDLGQQYTVTFLPDITTVVTPNCSAGTASITVQGGSPQVFNTSFTASNLLPSTATLVNNTAANNGSFVISGLQTGDNYSLVITDANGCSKTVSGGPFVGPPIINITPAGPFCNSDPATNLVASPAGGTWSGTGVNATGLFTPGQANQGSNNITYTYTAACTATSTVNIQVNGQLDATINQTGPFCEAAQSVNLTALSPGGTWSGTGITDAALGVFSPNLAGVGTFTITYSIPGNCGDTQTADFQVLRNADASYTPAGPFCANDADVTLVAIEPGGTWSGQGITNSGTGIFSPAAANSGNNAVTYTIGGTCGNSETQQIVVNRVANTTITAAGPFCANSNPVLLAAVDPGGTWAGPGITNSNTGEFNPASAGAGTHAISYTIAGPCGSSSNVTIIVNDPPTVNFAADNTEGCSPVDATLTNTSPTQGISCIWLVNGTEASQNCGGFTTSFSTPGCYDISLEVTIAGGCSTVVNRNDFICVNPQPVAGFGWLPKNATYLNPTINFPNSSTNAESYQWTFGQLGTSQETNPKFTFPDEPNMSYTVCLEAKNDKGCVDSVCHPIFIADEFLVYLPNSFTPNDDGLNDVFKPVVSGFDTTNYEFSIFNRWGEKLFISNSSKIGWNGMLNDKVVQDDVYIWNLNIRTRDTGEKKRFNGVVTLLKNY
jgi:gliding motility-associated-like protein